MRMPLRMWCVLCGMIFVLAASLKAMHPAGVMSVLNYLGLPLPLTAILLFPIVGTEAVLGVTLIRKSTSLNLSWLAIAVLSGFSLLLWFLLRHDDAPSCGCLGKLEIWQSRRAENVTSLVRNGALIVSGIVALAYEIRSRKPT